MPFLAVWIISTYMMAMIIYYFNDLYTNKG